MAKQVTIKSGTVFTTLAAAKDHFSKVREGNVIGTRLAEPHRSEVIDVYERYCKATGWQAVNAVDFTTINDNRKRPDGAYRTTKALAVIDASGAEHTFSIDGALKDIAQWVTA